MTTSRPAYRVRQFIDAFAVRMTQEEEEEVQALLSPAQRELFYSMRRPGQRHGLQVYRALRKAGHQDRDLLEAALLHDVGKGRVTVAHKVAAVLLGAFWRSLLERLSSARGPAWREGFHQHCHHGELGAQLAQRAGSSPRVVALIRNHQGPGHSDGESNTDLPGLWALRMADGGGWEEGS